MSDPEGIESAFASMRGPAPAQAVQAFLRLRSRFPEHVAVQTGLAEALIAVQRFDEARAVLDAAKDAFADNPWPPLLLAKIDLAHGEREQARSRLAHALQLGSDHAALHLAAYDILDELGDADGAGELIEHARTTFPTDTAVLRAGAARASKQQRWQEAYELWTTLADHDPESGEALHNAALALDHLDLTDRGVVVVYGNCQAEYITVLCRHVPSLTRRFRFVPVTNHGYKNRPRPPISDAVDDALLVWEQHDQQTAAEVRDRMHARIPAGTPVIRYPGLTFTALWPFGCADGRPGRADTNRYPFGDRVGLEVAALGLPRERLFERYMEISLRKMPDIKTLLDRDRAVLERRDAQSDVKMSAFIFEQFRTRALFDTWRYASGAAMLELIARLLRHSSTVLGDPDDLLLAHLRTAYRLSPSQTPSEVPIHPAVIEQVGLAYVSAESTYRWYGHRWTFEEYMTRYIALDPEW